MKRTLFLAWQDPVERAWHPIGRLTSADRQYSFQYVGGVRDALATGRFQAIQPFPDVYTIYESDELFPLFANRVLPRSRPEYKSVLEWLCVPESDDDPAAILARSGGQRATDTFEVFPCPELTEEGKYQVHFLVHGLRHMPAESQGRVDRLKPGDRLLAMKDIQNPKDGQALALRTAEEYPGDMHLVGYCPRYLRWDAAKLIAGQADSALITVERVNPAPAPVQFRVLCRMEMRWPKGFEPFSEDQFQPIVGRAMGRQGLAKVS